MPTTIPGVVDIDEFAALYKAGMSLSDIRSRFKIGARRVRKLVAEAGLDAHRHPDCLKWGSPEMAATLYRRYGSKPASVLAAEMGVTKGALIGAARRAGLCSAVPVDRAPLTDADFRGCRFIKGEARHLRPGMYCCAPTPIGDAWCSKHHAICYRVTE